MKVITKIVSCFLCFHLLFISAPMESTDAKASSIEFYNVKSQILDMKTYNETYDINNDGRVNVLDVIRVNKNTFTGKSFVEYNIDITSATNTIYASAGDVIQLTITSINGRVNVYTDGHTTDVYGKDLSKPGNYEYTVKYSGLIRLYPFIIGESGSSNVTGNISIKSRMDEAAEKIEHKVYTVGKGKDFSNFTEMLIGLENDTAEKIVYVDSGVYDIYQEIGGDEFINSITDPKSLNWRDVNHLLPPNTTLIGKGNVVLKFEPTAAQIKSQDMAFLFSPLNVSGNCHVENITIRSKNCRYSLHDECSGKPEYDGVTHEFVNVKCYHDPETYGIQYAYGAGHSKNSRYLFKNCVFKCTKGGKPWSSHDWAKNDNETTSITFENCIIDGKIRLSSSSRSATRADDVFLSNCYLTGINYSSEGGSATLQQGYKVTLIGCTDITDGIVYDSNIEHTFDTEQFNKLK